MGHGVKHDEIHALNTRLIDAIKKYWQERGYEPPAFYVDNQFVGLTGRNIPGFTSDMLNGLPRWKSHKKRMNREAI